MISKWPVFLTVMILSLFLAQAPRGDELRDPQVEIDTLIAEKFLPRIEGLLPFHLALNENEREFETLREAEEKIVSGTDYGQKKKVFARQNRLFREFVMLDDQSGALFSALVDEVRAELKNVFQDDPINMDEPTLHKTIAEAVEMKLRKMAADRPEQDDGAPNVDEGRIAKRYAPVLMSDFMAKPIIGATTDKKAKLRYKFEVGQKIHLTLSVGINFRLISVKNDMKALLLRNMKGEFGVIEIGKDGEAYGELVYKDIALDVMDPEYSTFDSANPSDFDQKKFKPWSDWFEKPFLATIAPDGAFSILDFDDSIINEVVKNNIREFHETVFLPLPNEEVELGATYETINESVGPIGKFVIRSRRRVESMAEDGTVLIEPTINVSWEQAEGNASTIRTLNDSEYDGQYVFNNKKGMAERALETRFRDYVDKKGDDLNHIVSFIEFRAYIE